jgi:hypothetical protein
LFYWSQRDCFTYCEVPENVVEYSFCATFRALASRAHPVLLSLDRQIMTKGRLLGVISTGLELARGAECPRRDWALLGHKVLMRESYSV